MPNSQHCFNCTKMKPCKCIGLISLFKGRPFSKFFKYLRRTAQRRRRSSRRFRSVHAVFWPLMSMRSEDRERNVEHPSLTLTETETEVETVLRPQPTEPTPLITSSTKIEPSPLPTTSSYTKTESNLPPISSSYTKSESNPLPTTSSYTKTESNPPPTTSSYTNPPHTTSSYTKTEPNPPLSSSSFAKTESSPPPSTSNTKIEPAGPFTSSHPKLEPTPPPPRTSSYAKRKPTRPTLATSYNKMSAQIQKVEEKNKIEDDEVQKACRNFEKYIMEMILEERKVRDLVDVEELMYCMDKLQAPAFIELVCTFYGELCVDLFSNGGDQPVLEAGAN